MWPCSSIQMISKKIENIHQNTLTYQSLMNMYEYVDLFHKKQVRYDLIFKVTLHKSKVERRSLIESIEMTCKM